MSRPTAACASLALALLLSASLPLGCRRNTAPAGDLKKKPGETVSRIVFVGHKDACDCTKKRVKDSWEALSFVLEKHEAVRVERIALDVNRKRYKALRAKRRFVTAPGIYFFDPKGKLVGMLQGEVKIAAIEEMLK